MLRILILAGIAFLIAGCDKLAPLPYEPVPCHGYAPDTVWNAAHDTGAIYQRVHACGRPRGQG